MLNEFQRTQVWEDLLAAETRALYFGDLASRYTHQKQWITGLSFFFASGAACHSGSATLLHSCRSYYPWQLRQ